MMYKWGHPVATLPSEEGDYTSLKRRNVKTWRLDAEDVSDFTEFVGACFVLSQASHAAFLRIKEHLECP
eukprot:924909-Pleurochrysis_carterae.AAC.1